MSVPTIGVVIATPGRRSLVRTLNSIVYQGLIPGDDVLIVGDGFHEVARDVVELFGPPFRYVATEKTRDWGHSQQNYGLQHIGGDWLVLQDDDDVFLPRAFDEIRLIAGKLESPRPIIGRVMTPYRGILWTAPKQEPLDGHCLVVPNDKKKLGYFGPEYEGDQKWLASNLEAYDTYSWADRIWTLTRPSGKLWPRRKEATTWTFHRDDGGVWSSGHIATLTMVRRGDDSWQAWLEAPFDGKAPVSDEELSEIVQFAAWAGQGCDVWFKMSGRIDRLIRVLYANGYILHEMRGDHIDYVFEWPPHKFEPPPKKEVTE